MLVGLCDQHELASIGRALTKLITKCTQKFSKLVRITLKSKVVFFCHKWLQNRPKFVLLLQIRRNCWKLVTFYLCMNLVDNLIV